MPSRPEVLTEAFRSVLARHQHQPTPDPPLSTPPPGYRAEWRADPEDGWRLATHDERRERKCRRPGCQRPPAVAFLRAGRGGAHWWLCCDWHLYGRRVRGGRVESRRLVPAVAA